MKKIYIQPNFKLLDLSTEDMLATSGVEGFSSTLDNSTEIGSGDLLSREFNDFWGSNDSGNGDNSSHNLWDD